MAAEDAGAERRGRRAVPGAGGPSSAIARAGRLLAAGALAVGLAAAARADEAADAFQTLYGAEWRRVTATPAAADDVDLASRLLRAVRRADSPAGLGELLCEKAWELGVKDPSGFATATAAMRLLASRAPARRAEALQRVVMVHQREHALARGEERAKAAEALIAACRDAADAHEAAGDLDAAMASLRQALLAAVRTEARQAIQSRLGDLAARSQRAKQVASLKARLQADPKDASSRRELVRLHLAEMDDPVEAAKYVDDSLDAATRKYLPAAARGVEAAPELACAELGDWLCALAVPPATPAGRTAVLARAAAYYDRFLALHAAEDADRARVAEARKGVEADLAALGAAVRGNRPRRLVVVTTARGIRHTSTPVAVKVLSEAGQKAPAFEATVTDDANVLTAAYLAKFDGVCLLNVSGEPFDDEAPKQALLAFVRGGKGVAAIHASIGACPKWPEYAEMLGAAQAGAPFASVSVKVDDPASPLTAAFGGKGFLMTDEIYSVREPYSRDAVHVLLSVDFEHSGSRTARRSPRADHDYPLSWIKRYGQGRVFCTALGHGERLYADAAFVEHVASGIRFALGDVRADATPSARLVVAPARGPALE